MASVVATVVASAAVSSLAVSLLALRASFAILAEMLIRRAQVAAESSHLNLLSSLICSLLQPACQQCVCECVRDYVCGGRTYT